MSKIAYNMPKTIWADEYGEYSDMEFEMPPDSTKYIRYDTVDAEIFALKERIMDLEMLLSRHGDVKQSTEF